MNANIHNNTPKTEGWCTEKTEFHIICNSWTKSDNQYFQKIIFGEFLHIFFNKWKKNKAFILKFKSLWFTCGWMLKTSVHNHIYTPLILPLPVTRLLSPSSEQRLRAQFYKNGITPSTPWARGGESARAQLIAK